MSAKRRSSIRLQAKAWGSSNSSRGAGEVIYVQAKMCVVYNHASEFPGAAVGDLAKPV